MDTENQNVKVELSERTSLNKKILISLGEGSRKNFEGPKSSLPQSFKGPKAPEMAIDYIIEKFHLEKYIKKSS